jgi:hypothetical protein
MSLRLQRNHSDSVDCIKLTFYIMGAKLTIIGHEKEFQ